MSDSNAPRSSQRGFRSAPRRKCRNLFGYPFPIPRNTFYDRLGVTPEATSLEIREAKTEMIGKFLADKAEADRRLSTVHTQLPELAEAERQAGELRSQGFDADAAALRKAEKRLADLEAQALKIDCEYSQLARKSKELEQSINEVNRINLENPDERTKYDEATSPCALLKIDHLDEEIFTERGKKVAFFLLRAELSEFLNAFGEGCYHPSDLTRTDFRSDFSYQALLDDED